MSTPTLPGRQEVTILSVIDIPSSEPARIGKQDTLITYQLDPMHTFQVAIPKETRTTAAVEAAVRADFAKQKELIGRRVSI